MRHRRGDTEKGPLATPDLAFHEGEFSRLMGMLEEAEETTTLPETPSTRAELNDLLLRIRRAGLEESPARC